MRTSLPIIFTVVTGIAGPGLASPDACGERDGVIDRLQHVFGEERTGGGLQGEHGLVEVFASSETGSWTILLTRPDGRACLVAAGATWHTVPAVKQVAAEPA
ncbi:hypothetical protein ACW9UR_11435 [Halovulum sp. GXIMD14794]